MKKPDRLTRNQIRNLKDLAALPDSQIDTSDIGEWSEEDFARSVSLSSLYKPRKLQITTRIDADVIAWLKSGGRSYQSRLNTILRTTMLAARRKAARKRPETSAKPRAGAGNKAGQRAFPSMSKNARSR
jgi:uncharacterized protein (DUF4415 family)